MNTEKSVGKRIEKLADHLYYIPEYPSLDCNIYILEDSQRKLCIIDTGDGRTIDLAIDLLSEINSYPKNIEAVLLTHEHISHIMGLFSLVDLIDKNSIEIYAHQITADLIRKGDEKTLIPKSLGISALNLGVKVSKLDVNKFNPPEIFSFGDFELEIYNTPGHSEGSVSFYDPNKKILFCGDVLFPHGTFGTYNDTGGDLETLKKSIGLLNKLNVDLLCPGHMFPKTNANESITKSLENVLSEKR